MKINIKTQTNRATLWREGLNCVNLVLADKFSCSGFEMGLQVTEWGSKDEIEPLITFDTGKKTRTFTISELSEKLGL